MVRTVRRMQEKGRLIICVGDEESGTLKILDVQTLKFKGGNFEIDSEVQFSSWLHIYCPNAPFSSFRSPYLRRFVKINPGGAGFRVILCVRNVHAQPSGK